MNERLLILAALGIVHFGVIETISDAKTRVADHAHNVRTLLSKGLAEGADVEERLANCESWLAAADQLEAETQDGRSVSPEEMLSSLLARACAEHDRVKALVPAWAERARSMQPTAHTEKDPVASAKGDEGDVWAQAAKELDAALNEPADEPITAPAERATTTTTDGIRSRMSAHERTLHEIVLNHEPGSSVVVDDPRLHAARAVGLVGAYEDLVEGPLVFTAEQRAEWVVKQLRVRSIRATCTGTVVRVLQSGAEYDAAANPLDAFRAAETLAFVLEQECSVMRDDPIRDPAERAEAVAKELRRRGIWATWRAHSGGIVRTMGFGPLLLGAEENDMESITHYTSRSDFPTLGPRAIADRIQAEEAKRAQAWAGDR